MSRINRYLGGNAALTAHLYPRLSATSDPCLLLDLGTGSADVPRLVSHWARAKRLNVNIIGLDWSGRNLVVARQNTAAHPDIQMIQADAQHIPLLPSSIDYVISSLFLHHFTPEQVIRLLKSAYSCARRAIIMTDLVRGWLPLIGFKLAQPIFARNFLTRHDGALSVRRAYTPSELLELATAAGLAQARVYTHWPYRMILVADK
jgi:hypothetical protein